MRNTCDSSKIESTVSLSSRASCSVVPNGFSITTRTATALVVVELRAAELLHDHREEARRGRQVEEPVQRFARLAFEAVEEL